MIDFKEFSKNISDEMLAAYVDGNATPDETALIESNIPDRESLQEVVDIVTDTHYMESHFDIDMHSGDYGLWELGMPPVIAESYDSEALSGIHVLDKDAIIHNHSGGVEKLSGWRIYGEQADNIGDNNILQPDDHSCALRSQQIILRDFGIDIPFSKMEQIAQDSGFYTNRGTQKEDVGKMLDMAGVKTHQVTGATIYDLLNELVQGHRVIAGIDANELWNNDSLTGKMKNWLMDTVGLQGGNHALIVAGLEVNPSNRHDVRVVLTDPGTGDLRTEYPLCQFIDAWDDTNCFMVVTDEPAPYRYDPNIGKEVPSGFALEPLNYNSFVCQNGFQMTNDMIEANSVSLSFDDTIDTSFPDDGLINKLPLLYDINRYPAFKSFVSWIEGDA